MLKNVYCNYGSPFNVLVCVYSSTAVKPLISIRNWRSLLKLAFAKRRRTF
jgi:hypothetical protein